MTPHATPTATPTTSSMKNMPGTLAEARRQLRVTQMELNDERQQHAKREERLRQQLTTAKGQIRSLEVQLVESRHEFEEAKTAMLVEVSRTRARIAELETQDPKNRVRESAAKEHPMLRRVELSAEEVDALRREIDQQELMLQGFQAENERATLKIKELEASLKQAQSVAGGGGGGSGSGSGSGGGDHTPPDVVSSTRGADGTISGAVSTSPHLAWREEKQSLLAQMAELETALKLTESALASARRKANTPDQAPGKGGERAPFQVPSEQNNNSPGTGINTTASASASVSVSPFLTQRHPIPPGMSLDDVPVGGLSAPRVAQNRVAGLSSTPEVEGGGGGGMVLPGTPGDRLREVLRLQSDLEAVRTMREDEEQRYREETSRLRSEIKQLKTQLELAGDAARQGMQHGREVAELREELRRGEARRAQLHHDHQVRSRAPQKRKEIHTITERRDHRPQVT